jgi:hypothetical protein
MAKTTAAGTQVRIAISVSPSRVGWFNFTTMGRCCKLYPLVFPDQFNALLEYLTRFTGCD